MTEPHLGDDAGASRRVRRTWKKKQRTRRIATIAAGVLIAAGFALFATETVRFGGGDRPTFAGAVRAQPASSTSSTTTTLPGRKCRAPLTDPDPLRLWVGGDSLAGSLGPSLGTIAGATGVVQPYFDSRVSSGLMSPTFFDWPSHAEKEMARLNPEFAVFIIGANDFLAPATPVATSTTTSTVAPSTSSGVNSSTGASATTTTSADDPWKIDYAQRVEAMLATLSAPGRTVIWVGPPPFKNDHDNVGIEQISEISKAVIARHPDAVFVDDYAMFLDANGKYADRLPDANGNLVSVRSGDGVHFTTEGGNQLARAVFGVIDAQCRVTAQAVAGVTKQTIQTEGSTLVAPGSNDRQGSTVSTTPPATSPPATTAPPAVTTTIPLQTTTTTPLVPQPNSGP